jgi:hypothetical protein
MKSAMVMLSIVKVSGPGYGALPPLPQMMQSIW